MAQDGDKDDAGVSEDKAGSSNDRVRRWNRAKAMPSDSKAGTEGTTSDHKAGTIRKPTDVPKPDTTSSNAPEDDDDDDDDDVGFWQDFKHPTKGKYADLGAVSTVSTASEVRKLQKALREIGRLELQQTVLREEGGLGKLRLNQLQKISKKQDYMDRLQELGALPSIQKAH